MKRRFEVYQEVGFDSESGPTTETIKTFKNEPDAKSFYNDPKNNRRYGTMYMRKYDQDGTSYSWDDRKGMWRQE